VHTLTPCCCQCWCLHCSGAIAHAVAIVIATSAAAAAATVAAFAAGCLLAGLLDGFFIVCCCSTQYIAVTLLPILRCSFAMKKSSKSRRLISDGVIQLPGTRKARILCHVFALHRVSSIFVLPDVIAASYSYSGLLHWGGFVAVQLHICCHRSQVCCCCDLHVVEVYSRKAGAEDPNKIQEFAMTKPSIPSLYS
jgi:hypothetical protein